jgi:DNA-binding transcriptional LysR family regulator
MMIKLFCFGECCGVQPTAYLSAVAEEGSVTRAAERLHRVPSNLSTRLRQLEEQLGVELFLRERQRLQLSPAGKVLLDYAHRLSALRDEALAAGAGGQPAGDFVLGTMYSTAAVHLPALLARYHQAYPAVNLQVQRRPSGELLKACSATAWMRRWWMGR